jgi:hypothetical protein
VLVALVVQPRACVAHKSPLTNRIRRHFARIKATGLVSGRSWVLPQIQLQIASGEARERSSNAQQT